MNDTRRAVFRIVIDGPIETIFRELTKQGEPQAAVFNAWLHAQALAPGQAIQMRTGTGKHVLVVGKVVEFEPPHRFAHTFRFTQYDDAECVVIYELKALPKGVECTLTVDRLPVGSKTEKDMQAGGTAILETLKAVVETGRPALKTRTMYAMFGALEFVLPAKTKAENWPLNG